MQTPTTGKAWRWLCGIALGSLVACGPGEPAGPGGSAVDPDRPDAMVLAVASAVTERRPERAWDTLPPSYQEDVNDLVHRVGQALDPDVYDKTFVVLGKLVDVLDQKRDLLLGNPMIGMFFQQTAMQPDEFRESWDAGVAFLTRLVETDIRSVEGLRELDVGGFLAGDVRRILESIPRDTYEASPEFAKLRDVRTEILSRTEDTARVRIRIPGEPEEEEEMVRVEGRWVPKSLAESWEERMSEMRELVAEPMDLALERQALAVLGTMEASLDDLLEARTPSDFHEAVAAAFAKVMQAGMREGFSGSDGVAPMDIPMHDPISPGNDRDGRR